MRTIGLLCALLACAPSAFAAGFSLGAHPTFGTNGYSGMNVYAAVSGGPWSLAPEYKRYSSDSSNGSYNTLKARLGYDHRFLGLGVTAGSTLEKNNYSNVFGGADLAVTLSPGGETGIRRIGGPGRSAAPTGKGIARVDLGGGVLMTQHSQKASGALAKVDLTQTDVHGFAGASVLGVLVSGRLSQSVYDKTIKNMSVLPSPRWTDIAGHLAIGGSYPDTSLNLRGEWTMLPMVAPFIGYTYTTYKELSGGVTPGSTRALAAGLSVGLELLAVEASYQHVSASGSSRDSNFTQLGVSLRM